MDDSTPSKTASNDSQWPLGGFVTKFQDSLSFVTVHYAGHEVPLYQPRAAHRMLMMYLSGELFATTQAKSSIPMENSSLILKYHAKLHAATIFVAITTVLFCFLLFLIKICRKSENSSTSLLANVKNNRSNNVLKRLFSS